MKEFLKPFADPAKVLLAAVSSALVTSGFYDAGTMAIIMGGVGAAATIFWTTYDKIVK